MTAPTGPPRVTAELHYEDLHVNHKKVARAIRRYRIQGLRLGRRCRPRLRIRPRQGPDLIGRDITAAAVNQRYVGDITYLPVGEGPAIDERRRQLRRQPPRGAV